MIKKYFIYFFAVIMTVSCVQKKNNDKLDKTKKTVVNSEDLNHNKKEVSNKHIDSKLNRKDSLINALTKKAKASKHDYFFELPKDKYFSDDIAIFAGYKEYNYEKNGYKNPAYLKILKNKELFYEESYEGYEAIWLNDLDGLLFNDSIKLFEIEYGMEACDYMDFKRLYYMTHDTIGFIDQFHTQFTDFASQSVEYLLPRDSGGIENNIIVMNKIYNRSSEVTKYFDTTYYFLNGQEFIKQQ